LTAVDHLFKQVLSNQHHVLAPLLPNKTKSHYSLRSRPHDRQLIPKLIKVCNSNFIVRVLYQQVSYSLSFMFVVFYMFFIVHDAFCHHDY